MKLGILGGTFDPIHMGHLTIAENARYYFQLDKVLFMLAAQPPHKNQQLVSAANHRLHMVELAVADNQWFEASTLEMERQGASYTVDTLRQLHDSLDHPELFFIMGSDSLFDLVTWYQYEEIARLSTLVSVSRPGFVNQQALDDLPAEVKEKILTLEVPGLDISSTELKRRLQSGEPVRYILPEGVEQYIKEHSLYGAK